MSNDAILVINFILTVLSTAAAIVSLQQARKAHNATNIPLITGSISTPTIRPDASPEAIITLLRVEFRNYSTEISATTLYLRVDLTLRKKGFFSRTKKTTKPIMQLNPRNYGPGHNNQEDIKLESFLIEQFPGLLVPDLAVLSDGGWFIYYSPNEFALAARLEMKYQPAVHGVREQKIIQKYRITPDYRRDPDKDPIVLSWKCEELKGWKRFFSETWL